MRWASFGQASRAGLRLLGFNKPFISLLYAMSKRTCEDASHKRSECQSLMDLVYVQCSGPAGPDWTPKQLAGGHKGRYLWTDAFAVVNYLTLYTQSGDPRHLVQAEALVRAVHQCLGYTRDGAQRLDGASEEHPTRGGLRIGKHHAEGHPDGDGQYYHYLTKWMFALGKLAEVSGKTHFLQWALELAENVHDKFVRKECLRGRWLCWKMSVDLNRPLVASQGNLDPFDGLCTYSLLQQLSRHLLPDAVEVPLQRQAEELRQLVGARFQEYNSTDPLDLGESLWLCHWSLPPNGSFLHATIVTEEDAAGSWQYDSGVLGQGQRWDEEVAWRALHALDDLWQHGYFHEDRLHHRLAFRELGATLGMQALLSRRPELDEDGAWARRINSLHALWRDRLGQHDMDITPVMYAASINPGVWLQRTVSNT